MMTPKKKMAGKPAMMKKAKDGKELAEVKVRPSFGQNFKSSMKNFMTTDSTDYQNTPAKTKAGKILRGANKVASTAARVAGAPAAVAASALGAGVKSVDNAIKAKKELNAIAKKKMGGKMKKYQAGGVAGKQPNAGMVDPKGAFTKVQERTLAGSKASKMKMGGSLKPVPAGKKGLAKLPTPVRNKMGFQKNGGKIKK